METSVLILLGFGGVCLLMIIFALVMFIADGVNEARERKRQRALDGSFNVNLALDNQYRQSLDDIAKSLQQLAEEGLSAKPAQPVTVVTVAEVPQQEEAAPVEDVAEPDEPAEEQTEAELEGGITIQPVRFVKQTLEEKYLELPAEFRAYYDEIVKYAANVEKAKHFRTSKYEDYRIGRTRLVRMNIKRGEVLCEFYVDNEALNFDKDVDVTQSATLMKISSWAAVDAAKATIDTIVMQDKERRKAKRKRKVAPVDEAAEVAPEAAVEQPVEDQPVAEAVVEQPEAEVSEQPTEQAVTEADEQPAEEAPEAAEEAAEEAEEAAEADEVPAEEAEAPTPEAEAEAEQEAQAAEVAAAVADEDGSAQ